MIGKEKPGIRLGEGLLEELIKRPDVEEKIISILGEKKWADINEAALTAVHSGGVAVRTECLILWSTRVCFRRIILSEIEERLRELNASFSVKGKSDERAPLLEVKQYLTPWQSRDRKALKRVLVG